MKKGCLILLSLAIIFCTQIALATNFTNVYLGYGNSKLLDSKNLTFVTSAGDTFVFTVDGITKAVHRPQGEVNGVIITFGSVFVDAATFNFTMGFVCGDGICSKRENEVVCCTDCQNCSKGFGCINNICTKFTCKDNFECNDNDNCTIDSCTEGKCINQPITECIPSDGCCPAGCASLTDAECLGGKCTTDNECGDNNPCTDDKCEGSCLHKGITGCIDNEKCAALGTEKENTYCSTEGWVEKKRRGQPCKIDYECAGVKCLNNLCGNTVNISESKELQQEEKNRGSSIKDIIIINGIGIAILILYIIYTYRKKE